jgi:phage head maturation protease
VITGVSIGYRVFKAEKVEDGSTTIPVFRATEWEPFEISPVDVPAEQGAGFRSERK